MKCGLNHVSEVILATFDKPNASTPAAALSDVPGVAHDANATTEALDELSLEETRVYKEKLSKYIKRSIEAVKEPLFFGLLLVGHRCREPLLHHYRFLCKKLKSTSTHVIDLVTSHIDTIRGEFDELMASMNDWITKVLSEVKSIPACSHMSDTECDYLILGSIAILLHNAAAFDRRTVKPFGRPMGPMGYLIIVQPF